MNKNKEIVIAFVLVAIVVTAGYLFWKSKKSSEEIGQTIDRGVMPSLGENGNPMENRPNVNPVDASNPFRSVKTNPFE